ncbi:methyltransferase family protein [Cyanobium sp. ATX-6F1]|uniref:methyltransferase family protein n=2 Tax=unclassified Cyanobium TaxID=2627006 RepID=UPI0039BDAAEA
MLGAMALIACGVARFLLDVPPAVVVPIPAAQILVLIGGGTVFTHYGLLKRRRGRFDHPEALLTRGGLFSVVRHPMYLGDALMDLGFALLAGTWLAFGIYGLCLVALGLQARVEDRHLAERFPEAHRHWSLHTGLLWPLRAVRGASPSPPRS